MSVRIRLTGGKAVAAVLVIGGFLGLLYFNAWSTLDSQAGVAVVDALRTEYRHYHLSRRDLNLPQRNEIIQSLATLSLNDISVRGRPSNMVVRVEIAPHPALPPDASLVRYFRMRHSSITGWSTPMSSYAFRYYLKLF